MKKTMMLLLLAVTITACGPAAPAVTPTAVPTWTPQPTITPYPTNTPRPDVTPIAITELDLSAVACHESDLPEGWRYEGQILEVPPAVFLREDVVNYYGVLFEGPDDSGMGCHLMTYDTLASAQWAYYFFVEDAAVYTGTVPIKEIGDERIATIGKHEFLGKTDYSYGVTARKGRFVLDLSIHGDKLLSLRSLDALLEAVVSRIPEYWTYALEPEPTAALGSREEVYIREITRILEKYEENIAKIDSLMNEPTYPSEAELWAIGILYEGYRERLLELEPPAYFEESHQLFVEATSNLKRGDKLYAEGVKEGSYTKIQQASEEYDLAVEAMQKGEEKLQEASGD